MAWYGTEPGVTSLTPAYLLAYWAVFLISLLVALYMALLDLRYIRYLYSQSEKELFEDTLGSEEFRTALQKARVPQDSRDEHTRDD